jgi:hypothetical protein
MSLTQKFRQDPSDLTVSVSALRHDELYRVTQAKRMETRHGKRVVLTLEDGDDRVIFVPAKTIRRRNGGSDMHDINTRRLHYYLTYRGKSSVSSVLLVDIEL